jgi:SAM-dependent methyltransferase
VIAIIEADIASMNIGRQFDHVISVGVIHHTDDPDKTVANLVQHTKRGGRLTLWVYSKEGNFLVRCALEPFRKFFLTRLSRATLVRLSRLMTAFMVLVVHSLYRLPWPFLPYYAYFQNFRKLSFSRNTLNVFDKLNAPQVEFIERARVQKWFNPQQFEDIHVSSYCGVGWRGSGRRM